MTPAPAPVTVGVPVYNGEAFLAECLSSLQAQTYPDFEVLISDNASSDGTEQIAREFCAQDRRFSYYRHATNIGGARNCNYLLTEARSPWFKWAFYDDICRPTFLAAAFAVLAAGNDTLIAAYPRVQLIDEHGAAIGAHQDADLDLTEDAPSQRLKVLLRRVVGQTQFAVMRTAVARDAGGIVASSGGEMAFPAAMVLRGPFGLIDEQVLALRVHGMRHGGNRRSEQAWVDPSRPRVVFPYSRSSWLVLREIRRAPLTSRERRRCVAVLAWYWTRPGLRTIVGDLLRLPWDAGLLGGRPA